MLRRMQWQHGPLTLPDPDATAALAGRIAPLLRAGDVLALSGPLGAGKSHFARSALRALGVTEDIPSPSFTLVQSYETTGPEIWHCDLYRLLDAPSEVAELGLEDAARDAALLVEWPDILPPALLSGSLRIALEPGDAAHTAKLSSDDPRWRDRLEPHLA